MPTTRGRSAVAWRWGWDGAPRLRERRPGPQRWASPATHTRSSRGGGREGGRQSCSLTAGSLPRPLPLPPQHPSEAGTLAAAGHGSAVPLRTQAGRRWPRLSPFQRPAAAGCPGSKFPPPVSGELGPARASDSKPVLLPTGRVAVTKTRRTDTERVWSPRSRGARWGRRCGGAAAAGAPRTCSRGNFYVPSALPQFFFTLLKKPPDVSRRPSLRTRTHPPHAAPHTQPHDAHPPLPGWALANVFLGQTVF